MNQDTSDLVIRNNKYCRTSYTDLTTLVKKISALHGCDEKCVVTTSGMQAIYLSLITICIKCKWKSFNLFYGDELYCDTPKLFDTFSKSFGNIYLKCINPNNAIQEFENYRNQTNVLFVESCTNPNGLMFDFNQLEDLRKISKNLIVIVDNTWLTNYILNPFIYDVDIVVTSLTKYYSSGRVIAGAVLFRELDYYNVAKLHGMSSGIHISPITVDILNEEIINTEERMISSSLKTIDILDKLKTNNKILKINHPYLNGVELPIYPSVFTIEMYCTKIKTLNILKSFDQTLKHETSFGCEYSKTDPYPKEISIKIHNNKGGYVVKQKTTWRISIGYNDNSEKVYNQLSQIIDLLQ